MNKDPIIAKTLEALGALKGGAAGEDFERIIVPLLHVIEPTITSVPGGTDSGYDGEGVSGGKKVQVTSTIESDVIGNMTKSIKEADKNKPVGSSRKIIVLTSQKLTNQKKQNLKKRIIALGHEPLKIIDQEISAELLYRNPKERLELLGVAGDPPSLSAFPTSNRLFADIPVIGRKDVLDKLTNTDKDLILVGQPGSGKTFLLKSWAQQNEGLFVVGSERGKIADDLRSLNPKVLIVDDAASRLDLIQNLRQIRQDTHVTFRIISTCWPHSSSQINESFGGDSEQIDLDPLSKPEIVEVAKEVGVIGPDDILREIVHQSAGKPGLTVTLCNSLINGDGNETLKNLLPDEAVRTIEKINFSNGVAALALFALGGEEGVSISTVANYLGQNVFSLTRDMENLSFGGLVESRKGGVFVVTPARLGHTFLKRFFFKDDNTPNSWQAVYHALPKKIEALRTLLVVKMLGGHVDDQFLQSEILAVVENRNAEMIESYGEVPSWASNYLPDEISSLFTIFADLGLEQARWTMSHLGDKSHIVGKQLLKYLPKAVIGRILSNSTGDDARRSLIADVKEWITSSLPGSPKYLDRRQLLAREILVTFENCERPDDLETLAGIALNIQHRGSSQSPSDEMTYNIREGIATASEIKEIAKIWDSLRPAILAFSNSGLAALHDSFHKIAYPSIIQSTINEETAKTYRKTASQILSWHLKDSNDWCVEHSLRGYIKDLRVRNERIQRPLLEVIFPADAWTGDFEKKNKRNAKKAFKLGESMSDETPDDVCREIGEALKKIREMKSNSHDFKIEDFLRGVILSKGQVDLWFEAICNHPLDFRASDPFLENYVLQSHGKLRAALRALIQISVYRGRTVNFALQYLDSDDELWSNYLEIIRKDPQIAIGSILRNEVKSCHYQEMLSDENIRPVIAGHVQIETLQGDEELIALWSSGVISGASKHQIEKIGKERPHLLFEWIKDKFAKGGFIRSSDFSELIDSLPEDNRKTLAEDYPDYVLE